MAKEKSSVYTVESTASCGSGDVYVNDITVTWGMNSIPTATVVLPLYQTTANVVVYAGEDQSQESNKESVYDMFKDAQDDDKDVTIKLKTKKLENSTETVVTNLTLSGWKVTGVSLQPQNRISPSGVVVTAMHPMCELLDSPGFFYAPGADYEKLIEGKETGNIVKAGDAMLDAIFEVIDDDEYTSVKLGKTDDYEAVKSRANIRLGKWIECDGDADAWPLENSLGDAVDADDYNKACTAAFAINFAELPQSVPFNALLSLCNQLGLYISPTLESGGKAKVKVLNPWVRESVENVDDKYVYSSQITRDTDPVVGVRFFESPRDKLIISTLASVKPIEDKTKTAGGEILYYFSGTKGRIINTSFPSFIGAVFSKLYKIVSGKTTSTQVSDGKTRASNIEYQDPKAQLKSVGVSEDEAESILDTMQAQTAKSIFVALHRKTQRASVTMPLVKEVFPEIGSFIKFDAGSAGENPTGMVTSVIVRASCSQGLCTTTINASYCGPVAKDPDKKTLINGMWEASSSDEDSSGKK